MTTDFNGWSNRETYLVNLWLTNHDGPTFFVVRDIATTSAEVEAADAVEAFVNDNLGEQQGLLGDLVNAALGRVDWAEIVRSLKEA